MFYRIILVDQGGHPAFYENKVKFMNTTRYVSERKERRKQWKSSSSEQQSSQLMSRFLIPFSLAKRRATIVHQTETNTYVIIINLVKFKCFIYVVSYWYLL